MKQKPSLEHRVAGALDVGKIASEAASFCLVMASMFV